MEIGIYLVALVPPLLYAATNHIDKILLERYFQDGGVGTLLLFSALLSVAALPVFYAIDPTVLGVGWRNLLLLAGVGIINVLLLWCYLQAIFNDEPTVVIIFYQLVPVIALVLGYFVLGEVITSSQTVAMGAIIVGALVLTVALDEDGRIIFRGKTIAYMLVASTCWASEAVLFKLVALEENVWRSLFWEHLTLVILGIVIFTFVPRYRQNFIASWRSNSTSVLGLNAFNEGFYIIGNSVAAYVVMVVPVTLTLLMNSFQPLFVMLIGLALNAIVPRFGTENVKRHALVQKIIAITITSFGAYQLGDW